MTPIVIAAAAGFAAGLFAGGLIIARFRRRTARPPDAGRAGLFRSYLKSIPAGNLAGSPGVTPAILAKVAAAGGATLADLAEFPFETVPTIGPAKAADLRAAVRRRIRDAVADFDAGLCPEGEEYLRRRQSIEFGMRRAESQVPKPAPEIPPPPPAAPLEHPALSRMRAAAAFGLAAAKADGRATAAEKAVVRDHLAATFGHDPILVRHLDPVLEKAAAAPPDADAATAKLKGFPQEELRALLEMAERVADAAGGRNDKERDFLIQARAAFGIATEPTPPPPPAPALPPAANPRVALDMDPAAEITAELVRRKFAAATDRLDPRKAESLGPDFVKLADAKRTAARAAAESLLAAINETLDKPAPPPPTDLRHNPDLDDAFG